MARNTPSSDRNVLHVEDFTAGLFGDLADVHQAGYLAGVETYERGVFAGYFEVVDGGIGGNGLRDDVAGARPSGIGADVVADQDDHAAAHGVGGEEILRGDIDSVVDVRGAAGR